MTSKPQGLGLGLAVCRSIVTAHEGTLWAENNPDGGASFCFELPCLSSAQEESRTTSRVTMQDDGTERIGRSYCTQSAMKTLVSPSAFALRLDANTSFFPSGENIGKPSNVSLKLIRSRPVPSTLIR